MRSDRAMAAKHEFIENAVASCMDKIFENGGFNECGKEYIQETVEKAVAKALEKRGPSSLSEGKMQSKKDEDEAHASTAASSSRWEPSKKGDDEAQASTAASSSKGGKPSKNDKNDDAECIFINTKSKHFVYHFSSCHHVKAESSVEYHLCKDCKRKQHK